MPNERCCVMPKRKLTKNERNKRYNIYNRNTEIRWLQTESTNTCIPAISGCNTSKHNSQCANTQTTQQHNKQIPVIVHPTNTNVQIHPYSIRHSHLDDRSRICALRCSECIYHSNPLELHVDVSPQIPAFVAPVGTVSSLFRRKKKRTSLAHRAYM